MIPVWPKVKLKSLYQGFFDGPHATPKESEEGAVFLGIKNVTEDGRLDLSEIRHIAEEDLAKWTKRVTPTKNDIVFSYEATLHRYARIPEGFRGCLGRRMALIRPDLTKVDINYLFSYFLSPLWRAEVEKHILSGATVDRIPLTNVPDFELYLPPLKIQKKIAVILSSYDELIENNLKRTKLLEEMAQITYEEWFVRMKFPGHETAVFDEETGLPERWVKGLLSEFTQFQFGFAFNSSLFNESKYGSPLVRIRNIPSSQTNIYSPEKVEDKYIINTGDLLVGMDGEFHLNHWQNKPAYLVQRVCNIKPYNKLLLGYLKEAVRAPIKFYESTISGATVAHLGKKHLDEIEIIYPSETEMKFFDNLLRKKLNLFHQNQLLKEARDILLPRLMTGMIDIEQVELPEAMLNQVEE